MANMIFNESMFMEMLSQTMNQTPAEAYGVPFTIITFLFALFTNTYIIWYLSKRFKFERNDIKYGLTVAFITSFVSFIMTYTVPIYIFWSMIIYPISFIIDTVLIKLVYNQNWKISLKMVLFWYIIAIPFSIVFGIFLGLLL